MGANFRITSRRKSGNLHLHLTGNFDGTSAMELIFTLREYEGVAEKSYIETDGISELQPFGQDVFRKNLSMAPARAKNLLFIGGGGGNLKNSAKTFRRIRVRRMNSRRQRTEKDSKNKWSGQPVKRRLITNLCNFL